MTELVPDPFRARVAAYPPDEVDPTAWYAVSGEDWLRRLPELLTSLLAEWSLVPDGAVGWGYGARRRPRVVAVRPGRPQGDVAAPRGAHRAPRAAALGRARRGPPAAGRPAPLRPAPRTPRRHHRPPLGTGGRGLRRHRRPAHPAARAGPPPGAHALGVCVAPAGEAAAGRRAAPPVRRARASPRRRARVGPRGRRVAAAHRPALRERPARRAASRGWPSTRSRPPATGRSRSRRLCGTGRTSWAPARRSAGTCAAASRSSASTRRSTRTGPRPGPSCGRSTTPPTRPRVRPGRPRRGDHQGDERLRIPVGRSGPAVSGADQRLASAGRPRPRCEPTAQLVQSVALGGAQESARGVPDVGRSGRVGVERLAVARLLDRRGGGELVGREAAAGASAPRR